jgi:uncharacterized metal-binding protein
MPSGRTHDEITLWLLPWVAGITWVFTSNSHLTLLVSGGFLFSGLMFGPDLDIYSKQFQRWGCFRWIWLPYQKSLHHRSFLSHGPVIGTVLRVVYLTTWIAMLVILLLLGTYLVGEVQWTVQTIVHIVARSLLNHYHELIALFVGCELGAMSHSLSDWGGSTYKRVKSRGWSTLLPKSLTSQKPKRQSRKSTKPKRQSRKSTKPRSQSSSSSNRRSNSTSSKRK